MLCVDFFRRPRSHSHARMDLKSQRFVLSPSSVVRDDLASASFDEDAQVNFLTDFFIKLIGF